jgi:threonine synthase
VDLSGVNSINFARIAAQIVYYFTSAVALGAPHRKVAFSVPSGNFGDAFAGYAATRMGLPVERIVVATNSNDILARAFEDGRYARGQVAATQSPAMDIQSASNFERLYFECVRRDAVETARAFKAFGEAGAIDIPPQAHAAMRELFRGFCASEAETARTMLATLNETGQLIDPHTAVGVAGMKAAGTDTPVIVLSTAHPAKFPEAVEAAAGRAPALPSIVTTLARRPERFERLPADADAVKGFVRTFSNA